MLMTKYFSSDAEKYVRAGSFRFGFLHSYKLEEGALAENARFSDSEEGSVKTHYSGGTRKRVDIPGLISSAGGGWVAMGGTVVQTNIRAFVFCASRGGYDPEHHAYMVNGFEYEDGTHYPGNCDLTHYAVIEVQRFKLGIDMLDPRNRFGMSKLWQVCDVGEINYSKEDMHKVLKKNEAHFHDAAEESFRAVFLKPEFFRIEREIRFVLPPNHDFLEIRNREIIVQSNLLRSSVIDMGSI